MESKIFESVLKNKMIKIIIISVMIIFIFSLATFTVYAVSKTTEPKNYATELLPNDYKMLLYVKNFKELKSNFNSSDFGKRFNNNYIYQDFKYKYFQSFDLFFVRLNFNIERFFDLIERDFLVGTVNNNFFVIASIDFKTKFIYSMLNLLPETKINETAYEKMVIYNIYKSGENIYLIQIDKYLVIANNMEIIKTIINMKIKKPDNPDTNIYKMVNDNELYYKTTINETYNHYKILPDFDKVAIKINFKNMSTELYGLPDKVNNADFDAYSIDDLDFLKILPADLSLCYFNRVYDAKNVITDIAYNGSKIDTIASYIKSFDSFKNGAYFLFNNFGNNNEGGSISPEIGFALRLKDTVAASDVKKIAGDMKKISGELFGIKNWDTVINNEKNLIINYSKDNDFIIIFYNKYFIICNNKDFADNIIDKTKKQQSSLYDKYYDKLSNMDFNNMHYYSCIDLNSVSGAFEPLFKEYLSANLNLNEDEYSKSFGDLFDYMKQSKPVFINLSYNKDSGYYGKIESIK